MNKPFFSLLIPAYKNVSFLKQCVNSILANSFEDFEIIICYQADTKKIPFNDKRIKTIYLEQPSSYLSRIRLYFEAVGKYVWFIDSDDEISNDSLGFLYSTIVETDFCDIYDFNYSNNYDSLSRIKKSNCKLDVSLISKDEYMHRFLSKLGTYPIFRKCLKKNDVTFYNENIFMADDALLTLPFIAIANRVAVLNECLYFYRINKKSGTHNLKSKYIEDLSTFLIHSLPFREKTSELEMMIFSFIKTIIEVAYSDDCFNYLEYKNTSAMVKIINNISFKTNPSSFKRLYSSILLSKKSKILYFAFRLEFKFCSLFRKRKFVTISNSFAPSSNSGIYP